MEVIDDDEDFPIVVKLCYYCFEDSLEEYEDTRRERIARANEYWKGKMAQKLPSIWMKLQLGLYDKQIVNKLFTGWFDFADYMKQENLKGKPVIVLEWEYIRYDDV